MKKYMIPETNMFVVRTVEMLCASGTPGGKSIPYTPGGSFSDEGWIG